MNTVTFDERLEGMRAVLWAITRVLDREFIPSRAACFELRTLANAGLQLAEAYFESPPDECRNPPCDARLSRDT
jgi:hypothetical protein